MAIGILMSNEYLKQVNLDDTVFIGELSLDGKINRVNRSISTNTRSIKARNKKDYTT